MTDPDAETDLSPAEAAYQRAAAAAKYVARRLSVANSLEHAPTSQVRELATMLEAARELLDRIEAVAGQEDLGLGDTQVETYDEQVAETQVAEVDLAQLAELTFPVPVRPKKR